MIKYCTSPWATCSKVPLNSIPYDSNLTLFYYTGNFLLKPTPKVSSAAEWDKHLFNTEILLPILYLCKSREMKMPVDATSHWDFQLSCQIMLLFLPWESIKDQIIGLLYKYHGNCAFSYYPLGSHLRWEGEKLQIPFPHCHRHHSPFPHIDFCCYFLYNGRNAPLHVPEIRRLREPSIWVWDRILN